MSNAFYWGITKKTITAFGYLFKGMYFYRKDQSGKIRQKIKVPIVYAPRQKFLQRILQQPNIENTTFETVLPRMSFEILSYSYDSQRKLNSFNKNTAVINGQTRSTSSGVPYLLEIALYIYAKNQEDALQIVEQILPKFGPTRNLTVKVLPEMNITTDVPFTLQKVDFEDNYTGDYSQDRTIIFTLTFAAQVTYYDAIDGYSEDLCGVTTTDIPTIHHVALDLSSTTDKTVPAAERMRTDVVPDTAGPDDDYELNESIESL